MKVNGIFDVFGAIILLAAIAVVATHPSLVTGVGTAFNTALSTAVKG